VIATAAGIGGKMPRRSGDSSSSSHSCRAEPAANCQPIQANMTSTIVPTTTAIARRSRAQATPESSATK
jgi:hypothetical protein